MQVFIFTINVVDGEKEDQFNGSPPRPQPRGPRTPPGPPPPDDDEDEPIPVSGRIRTDCVSSAAHHCLVETEFHVLPGVRIPVCSYSCRAHSVLGKGFKGKSNFLCKYLVDSGIHCLLFRTFAASASSLVSVWVKSAKNYLRGFFIVLLK